MRLIKILICALIICSLSTVGYAQAFQNRDAKALANELSKLMFGDEKALFGATVDGMAPIVKANLEQDPKIRPYSDVLGKAILEAVETAFNDPETVRQLRQVQIDILLETYTAKEMQELINFYNSPIGKRTAETMPVVMKKSMERGALVGQNVTTSPKFNKMIEDKVTQLQKEGKLPANFGRN